MNKSQERHEGVAHDPTGRALARCKIFMKALVFAIIASICTGCVEQQVRSRPMTPCKRNLKQLAFALHNYHDTYGTFPPPFIADAGGKPMHSWRVLILPFMEQKELYAQYDFSKPWDAAENANVLAQMPDAFRCPNDVDAAPNVTSYAAVYGEGCIFDPAGPVSIRDIKDGTVHTLMVGEVCNSGIPWTKPEDIDVSKHPRINEPGGFGSRHERGCQFASASASVHYLEDKIPSDTLDALFHRRDGKPVDDEW